MKKIYIYTDCWFGEKGASDFRIGFIDSISNYSSPRGLRRLKSFQTYSKFKDYLFKSMEETRFLLITPKGLLNLEEARREYFKD